LTNTWKQKGTASDWRSSTAYNMHTN